MERDMENLESDPDEKDDGKAKGSNDGGNGSRFQTQIDNYRQHLMAAEQKSQSEYDKWVITLSGGALGVSFAFLKDVVGTKSIVSTGWLLAAWICWALGISSGLASHFFSSLALRRAIKQTDEKIIYVIRPGGWMSGLTFGLNIAAGVLFLCGVLSIIAFVAKNSP